MHASTAGSRRIVGVVFFGNFLLATQRKLLPLRQERAVAKRGSFQSRPNTELTANGDCKLLSSFHRHPLLALPSGRG